jgi:rubrerythrin
VPHDIGGGIVLDDNPVVHTCLWWMTLNWHKDRVKLSLSGRQLNMLSKIPIDLVRIKKEDLDKEILRFSIIAELDAINLYEQMAGMTQNKDIRKLLLDVAREEKTHVGEFQTLLLMEDKEQEKELKEGQKEVKELLENEEG